MIEYLTPGAAFLAPLCLPIVSAEGPRFPIMDIVTGRLIAKNQASTREQLWQAGGKAKSAEEHRAVTFLRGDPRMREAFFNSIGGSVMNEMFQYGMLS